MKKVTAVKRIKVELLHEQMEKALTEFYGLTYRADDGSIILLVGDDEDEAVVLDIVDQHDHTGLTDNEIAEKAENDADIATVLAADAVVLGSVDPVEILEARIVRLETYIRQLQK